MILSRTFCLKSIYYYSYYKVNYFKILCNLLYSFGKTIVTIYNFRGFFDFFLTFT